MADGDPDETASPIVLADTQEYDIGQLRVRPRRLDVCWDGQHRQELEPRVMQVLVALAQASGEVVSRDELADLCWGGRIVGDHSLNRCIHALRQLARTIDPPPFEIETIPRIGYRLARSWTGEDDSPDPVQGQPFGAPAILDRPMADPGTRPAVQWRTNAHLLVVGAAVLLVGIVLALRWASLTNSSTASVAVVDSSDNPASVLAKDFRADLMQLAGVRADELDLTMNPKEAGFVIRVSLRRAGEVGRGDVALLDGHGGKVLWAGAVEVPAQQLPHIRPQIAAKLGQVLLCAIQSSATSPRLDPGTVSLYLAACERMEQPDEMLVGLLRKVTEQAPRFAEGWANLAVAEARLHRASLEEPETVAAHDLASSARSHLMRAREIDSQLGPIYLAEAELLPPNRFAQRIAVLEEGIAANPDYGPLQERLSLALFEVGRTTEAIVAAERASALDPLSPASRAALIASLAHAGNLPKARRALADAERIWPASAHVMNAKFSLEYRYGDAREAQEMIDRGDASLGGRSGGFRGPKIVMAARLNPSPENVARLVRFAAFEAKRVPEAAPLRLQSLGLFGAVEECYHVIDQAGVIRHLGMATDVLFRPHLREFRYDKRFPAVAARLGLMQYWQSSNAWPDFCRDPFLPYDCGGEARRVLGSGGR